MPWQATAQECEINRVQRGGSWTSIREEEPFGPGPTSRIWCVFLTQTPFWGDVCGFILVMNFLEDWTRRIWYLLARQEELKGDIGAETGFDQGDLIYLGAYFGGTINIDASFGAYDLAKATGRR